MNDNTLGIVIIIGIIVIGIATGGSIFRGSGQVQPSTNRTNSTVVYDEVIRAQQANQTNNAIQNNISGASIYKDKVQISYISRPGTFDAYIRLSSGSNLGSGITITGWKLKSLVTGNEYVIGGASNLPYPNSSNETPITVQRGARILISQIPSPIGTSFRTNKCTGFFEQNTNYLPPLEKMCPLPKENAPRLSNIYDSRCLDYIDRIQSCQVPPLENNLPDTLSLPCKQYINTHVNYNSCVALHQNDADFYGQEWRLFPDRPKYLWLNKRDTIELLDNAGKVVDTYSY